MPPMMMTTKARISTLSPMPTCTASNGPSRPPASAQSAAPKTKTAVNKALHIDAQRLGHFAVGGAGAHPHADPAFGDQQVEQAGDPSPKAMITSR
jgi:hypothetical protein